MKRLFACIFSFLFFTATVSFAGTVDTAQRMLNQLGYNAGPVDGAYGGKTRAALEKFYAQSGSKFDGNLDANEIADLRKALQESPVKFIPAEINVSDQYKLDNFPGLVALSYAHSIRKSWFGYTEIPFIDATDDGYNDLIFYSDSPDTEKFGGRIPQNSANLIVAPYVAKWKQFDMFETYESKNTTLIAPFLRYADMNGDNRVDIIVAASELFSKSSTGGAYVFFNQGNGTFRPQRISRSAFTHSHGVGDLDNDGDIDIVYHQLGAKYVKCELNDGKGNFKRRDCLKAPRSKNRGWVQNIWGFKLADYDNDGYTDMAVFPSVGKVDRAWDGNSRNQLESPTIFWGDGTAQFSYENMSFLDVSDWTDTAYEQGEPYFTGSWGAGTHDFGNDKDIDLIFTMMGDHSIGSAILLAENLGSREFKIKELYRSTFLKNDPTRFRRMQDKTNKVRTDKDYTWLTEGLVWNDSCGNVQFVDINSDGNDDFICGGSVREDSNAEVAVRWQNDMKRQQKIMPWLNTSDWDPRWSMKHIYIILDKHGNPQKSGKIFNKDMSDFSDVFKTRGYKIKTLGWRN